VAAMHSLRSLRSQNLDQQLKPSRRLLMDSVHTSERPVFWSQHYKIEKQNKNQC
jgi:hypothetical protein